MINKYDVFLKLYSVQTSVKEGVEPKYETPPDIKPLIYDNDNKCMIGVYKLISRDENKITILNIQEIPAFGYMIHTRSGVGKLYYVDGKQSGYSIKRVIDLPTKKIHILKELSDGYCELGIPYFIYKQKIKELKILKLDKNVYRIVDKTSTAKNFDKYI